MTLGSPGVKVEVSSQQAVPSIQSGPLRWFVSGYAPWGPVNVPVFLGDLRKAMSVFGAPIAGSALKLPQYLKVYFEEAAGTGRAMASRSFKLNTGDTLDEHVASVALVNGSDTVLKVKGAWPGALGNGFKVDVINGPAGGKKIYLWGRYSQPEVFDWVGLSGGNPTQAEIQKKITDWNAQADSYAKDFRLELETFVAAGPAVTSSQLALFRPSATALPLTGGSDGQAPDASLTYGLDSNNNYQGISVFDKRYGPGLVSIVGFSPTLTITNALENHARATGRTAFVSLIPSSGNPTAQDILTFKATLTQSDWVSYYYPEVYNADNELMGLEAYAAALNILNASSVGLEGGVKTSATGKVGISGVRMIGNREPVNDESDAELLAANKINYVRYIDGTGYRLDAQYLSAEEGSISRVHHRNTANYFQYILQREMQKFRDRTIDGAGALQDEIQRFLKDLLDPFGPGKPSPLGDTLFDAAIVITDDSIQSNVALADGELAVYVEAAFSPKAEKIRLFFNVVAPRIA